MILLRPTERMTGCSRRMRRWIRREGRVAVASFPHSTFLVQKLPFGTKIVEGWEGYDMSLGLLDDSNLHIGLGTPSAASFVHLSAYRNVHPLILQTRE